MKQRHAFTIFELLVIIAIIAIQVAILLPGLSKERDKARSIACINNLKTVGMSYNLYGSDNNDIWIIDIAQGTNWVGALNGYGNTGKYLSSGSPDETICPGRPPFKWSGNTGYMGYGHRRHVVPSSMLVTPKATGSYNNAYVDRYWIMSQCKGPSGFPVLGDSRSHVRAMRGMPEQSYVVQFGSWGNRGGSWVRTSYFHCGAHGNHGNFLYADGHVAGVNSIQQLVGQFREEYTAQGQEMAGFGGYEAGPVWKYVP